MGFSNATSDAKALPAMDSDSIQEGLRNTGRGAGLLASSIRRNGISIQTARPNRKSATIGTTSPMNPVSNPASIVEAER